VEQVLKPIWHKSTGSHVHGHLEAIIHRATANLHRVGDNPASLKGPLGTLLHAVDEIRVVKHHASLPYQEIGAFIVELQAYKVRKMSSVIIVDLIQFIILTAVRSGQAREMRWSELDEDFSLWTCPWQRTKTGKKTKTDHLVPLSEPARAVLKRMRDIQSESDTEIEFVFPQNVPHGSIWSSHMPQNWRQQRHLRQIASAKKPLSIAAPVNFLKYTLDRKGLTVHGFRTTFSTWANEHNYPREAIEMALDHKVGNDVEKTYNKAQRLEQRRKLMEAWAEFCGRAEPLPAEVIPIRQAKQ
jgi:integrase